MKASPDQIFSARSHQGTDAADFTVLRPEWRLLDRSTPHFCGLVKDAVDPYGPTLHVAVTRLSGTVCHLSRYIGVAGLNKSRSFPKELPATKTMRVLCICRYPFLSNFLRDFTRFVLRGACHMIDRTDFEVAFCLSLRAKVLEDHLARIRRPENRPLSAGISRDPARPRSWSPRNR